MSARNFLSADLPVVISSWEIECCGPLPTVGQPTSWRLIFLPVDLPDDKSLQRDPGSVTELQWQVEPLPDSSDGRALYRNGFAAYFYQSDRAPGGQTRPLPALGRQSLRGIISGTRHGGAEYDTFNSVTATIGRIQVVSWEHRVVERMLVRVPGSVGLRDVHQSPKWFSRTPPPSVPQKTGRTRQERGRAAVLGNAMFRDETGLFLTLRDDAFLRG